MIPAPLADRRIPRIAVDALGGDYGPSVVVPGAVAAQRELGESVRIQLFGDEATLIEELKKAGASTSDFDLVHAPENIEMHESPAAAIRRKRNSPIVMACEKMKAGESDALVGAGSTGAMAAAGLLIVGRLPQVRRPAIASHYPTKTGVGLVLDIGANADCKPMHLLQFGVMGRIYARHVLGVAEPRLALMNIGEEPSKGSELALEAHRLMQAHEPNFAGNIEGRDLFEGKVDVIVTDGFTGNVILKILESCAGFLASSFREVLEGNPRAKLGAWLLLPAIKDYAKRFDYAEYGGAPLLGLHELLIICHGGSSSAAITNAIKAAVRGVEDGVVERIRDEIAREEREVAENPLPPENTESTGATS